MTIRLPSVVTSLLKYFSNSAFFLALSLLPPTVFAANVDGVRVWRAPDHTRVVFDLSSPAEHQVLSLENPDRIVIDIPASKFKASLDQLELGNTPVQRVRTGVRNGDDLRVVLDLQTTVKPRSFLLKASDKAADRLVIDLYDLNGGTPQPKTVVSVPGGKRNIVVAIDPGHGGEDPGAIGPKKLMEKHVVLDIARELKRQLDATPGYKGVLLRDGDYYVGLYKRRDLARQKRADLFVSIHADAFSSPQAHGSSVYALSQSGATSASARFLAQAENKSDVIGGVRLNDKDDVLAGVLFDLSMTASLDASLNVGKHVLKRMGGINRLHKKKVEQAGFAVLKSPDVPSILVETGFISNPAEAKKLSTKSYQRKMARMIASGVSEYFNQNPPEGTLVAFNKSRPAETYTIARGDTLSEIAERHRVSVAALRNSNNLKSNTIRIGQTLRIPAS